LSAAPTLRKDALTADFAILAEKARIFRVHSRAVTMTNAPKGPGTRLEQLEFGFCVFTGTLDIMDTALVVIWLRKLSLVVCTSRSCWDSINMLRGLEALLGSLIVAHLRHLWIERLRELVDDVAVASSLLVDRIVGQ
jgi:hypothetical protein